MKNKIMTAVQEILNERGMNVQVELKSITKNNGCNPTGIQFRKEDDALVSVIYIDEMIHQVDDGDITVEDAAKNIIRVYEQNVPPVTGNNIMKMLKNTDNIIFQLVNTKQNKELLDEVPHREYLDLSIIYRSIISNENGEISSTIIKNPLAKMLGLSEEDLFRFAVENTRRLLPPVIYDMNDFIIRQASKVGVPMDDISEMIKDSENAPKMYLITNKLNINGAAAMLYEDKLHEIAESLGTDLYILPSSIHEVFTVSADGIKDLNELKDMVSMVNSCELIPEERLSNNVYLYDKDLRKVSLATDSVVPLV